MQGDNVLLIFKILLPLQLSGLSFAFLMSLKHDYKIVWKFLLMTLILITVGIFVPVKINIFQFSIPINSLSIFIINVLIIVFIFQKSLKVSSIIATVSLLIQHISYNLSQIIINCIFFSNTSLKTFMDCLFSLSFSAIIASIILIADKAKKLSLTNTEYKASHVIFLTSLSTIGAEILSFNNSITGFNLIIYFLLDILFCISILYIIFYSNISLIEQYLLKKSINDSNERYKALSIQIDKINKKSHDLKYLIAAIENDNSQITAIKTLKDDLNVYEKMVKTKNLALDNTINEKALICEKYNIKFLCTLNAEDLNFMDPVDLYIIFGNVLDNAIEASKVCNSEDKFISIEGKKQNNILMITIENCSQENIRFENGFPVTSKNDKLEHGIGLKSVSSILLKYNGILELSNQSNLFTVSIMIPLINKEIKK